jgi:hypothetical protein
MKLDVDFWNNPTGNVNADLFMNEEFLHIDARAAYIHPLVRSYYLKGFLEFGK